MGKVYQVDNRRASQGEYISKIYDLQNSSIIGNIRWTTLNDDGKLSLSVRTGFTEKVSDTWTEWSSPLTNKDGSLPKIKKGRYFQFKAMFNSTENSKSPILQQITIPYLCDNRPPNITSVEVKYDDEKSKDKKKGSSDFFDKDTVIEIDWKAEDADNDVLLYNLYIKNEENDNWLLLAENIKDDSYKIDSIRLSNGIYEFKIVATDKLSNPLDIAKTGDKISNLITVDNSKPEYDNINIEETNEQIIIRGLVKDDYSIIRKMEYSLNTKDWLMILPQDFIYDQKTENFIININKDNKKINLGDNLIIIRTEDDFGNHSIKMIKFKFNK